jgi:single-strand DNA-binding protein
MYQHVVIVGYLGRDPEMRYTQDGTPVTTMSVATSRKWKGADGQMKEETTWFRVTVWGRMAEACNQYLSKGRLVLVEGTVTASAWKSREGEAMASLELRATGVKFLGGGRGEGDDRERTQERSAAPAEDDDPIPF